MEPAVLTLKKREERRLRAGHLWVFSNEVDVARSPLTDFEPGQPVVIETADGKAVGAGYVNPASLICARLVSRDPGLRLDRSLLVHRLNVALGLRERLYEHPYYRLVHGEADGLPGLVIDRFGETLVVQMNTAGMERVRPAILEALEKVLKPRGILLRNDSPIRQLENLEPYVEAIGEVPEAVRLEENGVAFEAPLAGGQKTGWFFDHRDNRAWVQGLVRGMARRSAPRVLDVFSYIGGWGIQAAVAGAGEVACVEASGTALDWAERNAALNGVEEKMKFIEGDAFQALKALRADREQFDLVVLDPPAFIKRRKDVKSGLEAYRRINQAAMQLLGKDGILVSASCSHHLRREQLFDILQRSARHLDRRAQVIHQGYQAGDHPIHPAIPETEYLKAVTVRVVAD